MRYNKDFIGVQTILQNVLSRYELKNRLDNQDAVRQWQDLQLQGLGRKEWSDYFVPKYLREGILYLEVVKSARTREVKMIKQKLEQLIPGPDGRGVIKGIKFI
jgi:hypothetical protein